MKRKAYSFITFILVLATFFCLTACGGKGKVDVSKITLDANAEEGYVAILVGEESVEEGTTLLTVMKSLQKAKRLTFSLSSGMVTELEGRANAESAYWLLYTSDGAMANAAWGSYSYGERTLDSAILGAGSLLVKEGELYVWSYQAF